MQVENTHNDECLSIAVYLINYASAIFGMIHTSVFKVSSVTDVLARLYA
jgi:hypothetical protein